MEGKSATTCLVVAESGVSDLGTNRSEDGIPKILARIGGKKPLIRRKIPAG